MLLGISLIIFLVLLIQGARNDSKWFLKFADILGQGPGGAAERLDRAAHYDFQALPSLCTARGYKLLCTRNVLAFLSRESGEQAEYSIGDVQDHRADVSVITRNNRRLTLRMVHEDGKWKLDDFRTDDRGPWMSSIVGDGNAAPDSE